MKNSMLENNTIVPNSDISNDDKARITGAMSYLTRMNYTENISWLPKDFDYYRDFTHTFGFNEYYEPGNRRYEYVYVNVDPLSPVIISGYDAFLYLNLYGGDRQQDETVIKFEKNGQRYSLTKEIEEHSFIFTLKNESGDELISYSTKEIVNHFYNFESSQHLLPSEEAAFTIENNHAAMKVVVQNLHLNKSTDSIDTAMDVYIFVKIK